MGRKRGPHCGHGRGRRAGPTIWMGVRGWERRNFREGSSHPAPLSTTLSTAISCDLATEEEDAGPTPGLDWTGGGRRGALSPKPFWGAWPDFAPEPCVTGCQ